MGLYARMAGIVTSFFTWGEGGPGINVNGAALEVKNNANSGFAVMRGANPVGANDFVTLGSLPGGLDGPVLAISVAVGTANATSTAQIPLGAIVVGCQLNVTTPYSAGTTIEVGFTGTPGAFLGLGDNTATAAGLYKADQQTTLGGNEAVLVTVLGGPAAGVSQALVLFTIPST